MIALDVYPCEPFLFDKPGFELAITQQMDVLADVGPDAFKLQEVSTNQTLTDTSFVFDSTTQFTLPRPTLHLPSMLIPEFELQQARCAYSNAGGRDGRSPCGDVTYWGETILLQEAA